MNAADFVTLLFDWIAKLLAQALYRKADKEVAETVEKQANEDNIVL